MNLENTRTEPELISFTTIRRAIGFLGMLLPAALVVISITVHSEKVWQESISHYYYTLASGLFVGSLCAVGLFLITYKGFGPLDDFATNTAGVFAFCIALFPTTAPPEGSSWNIYSYAYSKPVSEIHLISAALFFITLSLISIFLFTKGKKDYQQNPQKRARNRIYTTCGVLMLLFVILIGVYMMSDGLKERYSEYNPTFWLECFALISFGVSWLVKGDTICRDKTPELYK